jgi:murein DD-endopeptidase MepM/ murein hydrolase activator NlpD
MLFGIIQAPGQSVIIQKYNDLMVQVSQEYTALISGIKTQIQQTIHDSTSAGESASVSGTVDEGNLIHIGTPVSKEVVSKEEKQAEEDLNVPVNVERKEASPPLPPAVLFLPTIYPIDGDPKISSPYGYRKDPFTHRKAFHHGIDIEIHIGTPVYACGSGVISDAGFDIYGGKFIEIDHGNEYRTLYAHLSKILVHEGDYVGKGKLIGKSGNTGRLTGPHIHYQVNFKGKSINPLSLID